MNQSVNLFAALHTFIQCLQSTCSYQGSCRMPQGISLLCDILAGSEISNWYHLRNYYLVIYNTVVTNKSTVHKNRLNAVVLQKPLSHAGIIVYSISGRLDDKKSIFSHLSHVTLVRSCCCCWTDELTETSQDLQVEQNRDEMTYCANSIITHSHRKRAQNCDMLSWKHLHTRLATC